MLSKYNYYTGIIFRAYTYGTGDTVANGGRYDNLVGQFGKEAPAIGLAVMVDQLMLALTRQKIDIKQGTENTLILYKKELLENAIMLANHFRNQEMNIELLCYDEKLPMEEYIAYSKRNGNGGILYFDTASLIQVINSESGEIQKARIQDFLTK
jgi:ATP phosphoribosyltransferase regulatory subunit